MTIGRFYGFPVMNFGINLIPNVTATFFFLLEF